MSDTTARPTPPTTDPPAGPVRDVQPAGTDQAPHPPEPLDVIAERMFRPR